MKCHIVLNAFSKNFLKQASELKAFLKDSGIGLEKENTYCICGPDSDREQIRLASPGNKVILLQMDYYQPETVLEQLSRECERGAVYLFGNDYSGRELSIRLSARMEGSGLSQVSRISCRDGLITAEKSVYSGQLKGTFELKKPPYCFWIAKGEGKCEEENTEAVISREISVSAEVPFVKSRSLKAAVEAKGLEEAAVLIAAGKGISSKQDIETLKETAGKLKGEWGVSRPVVMQAWAPMERMIGVSGSVVRPEICIVAGASGAAAFYAGIEKSKWIAAINEDAAAPIMKKADVIIEDDCRVILEELGKCIDREKEHG